MAFEYIVSIVIGGLFALMFLIFLIAYGRAENKKFKLYDELEKIYSDKNLVKMDYDFAVYDEETEKILSSMQAKEGQLVIEDVIGLEAAAVDSTVFGTVDTDGLEEITGNYKP